MASTSTLPCKRPSKPDVAIVMVGDNPRETVDKTTLSLPVITGVNQEQLVPAILAANPNTVVVLKTEGMVLMPWLPQARALIEAWYPGQDDGDVVANVLFGVTNPSGKLPVTFGNTANEAAYETEAQYAGIRVDNGLGGKGFFDTTAGGPQLTAEYSENLQVGYRWYQARNVQPVFPFGHGLSYTTFAYSDINVATSNAGGKTVADGHLYRHQHGRPGRKRGVPGLPDPAHGGKGAVEAARRLPESRAAAGPEPAGIGHHRLCGLQSSVLVFPAGRRIAPGSMGKRRLGDAQRPVHGPRRHLVGANAVAESGDAWR